MKILKLLSVTVLLVLIVSCATKPKEGVSVISAESFKTQITNKNVQLVDVRTPEEYNEAHIENAINIDVNGNNFTNEIAKLDKSKPVYIYCRSGGRSANAANIMQQEGFKTVNDLDGGFLNWQSKGYQSSK